MRRKQWLGLMLAGVMTVSLVSGCAKSGGDATAKTEAGTTATVQTEAKPEETAATEKTGDKEVLEFYHGYYHDESEWAPAKAMRDIYDEFAKQHADGPVKFKAIPTENIQSVVDNKVAGGAYPRRKLRFSGSDIAGTFIRHETLH